MQAALARKNRSPSRLKAPAPAPAPARTHPGIRNILRGAAVQPKLKIGAANDPAEREADRVADQVMRMPMPGPGPKATAAPPLAGGGPDPIRRMCAGCEDELQRKETPGGASRSPEISSLGLSGSGAPLAASERAFFEPRFGRDFSGVRIHSDSAANDAASSINARAFTLGPDIAFARGEYAPGSASGRHLLAHELVHTMQQPSAGRELLQRVCTPSAICSAPSIPGSPEDFSAGEQAREAGPRSRRRAMTTSRARSTGHAGRARQLENVLSAHDPARLSMIHGIFIDADLSSKTGAMVVDCAGWATDALPAGDPDPAGFAAATKDCVFIHGHLNQEAFVFNRGQGVVRGQPAADWQLETLNLLIHEAEHVRFDTTVHPGLVQPPGVTTPTCTKSAAAFSLSEIASIMSEFPLLFNAASAEANPSGPAHTRLDSFLDDAVSHPSESFNGALNVVGCRCECHEVDLFVIQTADAVTTSWTPAQKTAFRSGVQARMLGPVGPMWPAAPSP